MPEQAMETKVSNNEVNEWKKSKIDSDRMVFEIIAGGNQRDENVCSTNP